MRMLHEDPRNHTSFWMTPGLEKGLKRLKYAKCQNMVHAESCSSALLVRQDFHGSRPSQETCPGTQGVFCECLKQICRTNFEHFTCFQDFRPFSSGPNCGFFFPVSVLLFKLS